MNGYIPFLYSQGSIDRNHQRNVSILTAGFNAHFTFLDASSSFLKNVITIEQTTINSLMQPFYARITGAVQENPAMLNARFESAEATFVAGII